MPKLSAFEEPPMFRTVRSAISRDSPLEERRQTLFHSTRRQAACGMPAAFPASSSSNGASSDLSVDDDELCEINCCLDAEHGQRQPSSPTDSTDGQSTLPPITHPLHLMLEALRERLPADACEKIQDVVDRVRAPPFFPMGTLCVRGNHMLGHLSIPSFVA